MGSLVAAACASHSPGITALRNVADPGQRERFDGAMALISERFRVAAPDAIVVLTCDHFNSFFLDNLPPFCVGIAEEHSGPPEDWIGLPRRSVPGDRILASNMVTRGFDAGFDFSFSEELILDHGTMIPLHYVSPAHDIPVVPIFVNALVPPMPPLHRMIRLGEFLRDFIADRPADERIAVLGTGGLSHSVGTPTMGQVDQAFDRHFLKCLRAGAVSELEGISDDDIERAGNGTHEIRTWIAVAASMAPQPAKLLAYEPGMDLGVTGCGAVLWETSMEIEEAALLSVATG